MSGEDDRMIESGGGCELSKFVQSSISSVVVHILTHHIHILHQLFHLILAFFHNHPSPTMRQMTCQVIGLVLKNIPPPSSPPSSSGEHSLVKYLLEEVLGKEEDGRVRLAAISSIEHCLSPSLLKPLSMLMEKEEKNVMCRNKVVGLVERMVEEGMIDVSSIPILSSSLFNLIKKVRTIQDELTLLNSVFSDSLVISLHLPR